MSVEWDASIDLLVGIVPLVAPELIKSMQEQQRQFTQALLDKVRAIYAEHGVRALQIRFPFPEP